MSKKQNKTSRQSQLRAILVGLAKYFQNVSSLTLGGVAYTPADLERLVQQDLDQMATTAQAKAVVRAQVQVERNARAKLNPVLRQLKSYVIATYGDTAEASTTLEDFGYTPRKSSKKTLDVKVEARDQGKATRKARATMGPKEKAKIKGTVPETSPTPASVPQGTPKSNPS
jgi:hypothetical protein